MNQLATATERTVDARAVHNRAATIPQWLDRLAQRATGNSVLVERRGKSADWESVTFTDLLARIRKYAAALSALGARKS